MWRCASGDDEQDLLEDNGVSRYCLGCCKLKVAIELEISGWLVKGSCLPGKPSYDIIFKLRHGRERLQFVSLQSSGGIGLLGTQSRITLDSSSQVKSSQVKSEVHRMHM